MAYTATNTMTGLIPTIYQSMDRVSREMVGMIGAVTRDSKTDSASINQTVRSAVAPDLSASDVEPGAMPNPSGLTYEYKDITINKWKKAVVPFDQEEVLDNVKMADNFAQAFRTLSNAIEADLTALSIYASRAYGTAALTPFGTANDLSDLSQVRKILVDNGAPMDDLHLVLNTAAGANLRGKMSNIFKVNEYGSNAVLNFGNIANAPLSGFTLHESGQISAHTAGTAPNLKAAAAAALNATSITVSGTSSGALAVGDILTIGSYKYVNQTAVADVDTPTVISIPKPGLRAAVSQNDAITISAAYTPNIALSRNAIVLAQRVPKRANVNDGALGVEVVTDPFSGLSFEVAQYGIYRKGWFEVSCLWGVAVNKPQHLAILQG
jgi:hypothetical protein